MYRCFLERDIEANIICTCFVIIQVVISWRTDELQTMNRVHAYILGDQCYTVYFNTVYVYFVQRAQIYTRSVILVSFQTILFPDRIQFFFLHKKHSPLFELQKSSKCVKINRNNWILSTFVIFEFWVNSFAG